MANTSEIGVFKIVSEGGIGAGVRRIEALTGKGAYVNMKQSEKTLDEAASLLKANPRDLVQKVEATQADIKSLQRENESLLQKVANAQSGELLESARKVGDVTVLSAKVQAKDNNQLRQMVDDLKAKFEQAVIVLGASDGDKVMLAAGVSKNIAGKEYHAGNIVKAVAEQCGGKGGGRPDMAMAGAKNPEQLDAALESVYTLVK